jgi:hypothetical protein
MSTNAMNLESAVVTCFCIMSKINTIESAIKDLEGQREHNAGMGNWAMVKAAKDQVARLNRDKMILNRLMEDAEER